jgi:pyruvate/2-oxoglutarate dehydrogenase complex dihydrolipoamide acyltransferase (E2) component
MASNFVKLEKQTAFRRMAAAMWVSPNDSQIYGNAEIEMTAALHYLRTFSGDAKPTVTHLIAKALAVAIAKHPEINARVRFWGKLERRKTVDLFLQVTSDDGRDLSGHRIASADQVSLADLAKDLKQAAQRIRKNEDPKFKKSKGMLSKLPWWFLRTFLKIGALLTNELNLDLSGSGMPRDPFGSAMVTSLGMFGVDEAYAPLTPIAKCMMILLVPAVREKAVVENGQVVVRPMLKLCATFDHRVVDGVSAAKLCITLRELLAEPQKYLA